MTKAIEPAEAHSVATKPATQQSATATEAVIDAPTTKTAQAAQGSKTLEPTDIVKNKALLGGYAYHIIRQQSKQISKLRSQVLADTDIEDLHEMRISSRRLRSALGIFSDVVEISSPNEKSGKKSGKKKAAKKGNNNNNLIKGLKDLTQTLGTVRDLDVMKQWFEDTIQAHQQAEVPPFSKAEKKEIKTLLKRLKKQRKKQFSQLEEALKGNTHKKLVRQFKQWVKQPTFSATAQQPADSAAAQKIIAPITHLLAHPGWQMATRKTTRQGQVHYTPLAKITLPQLNRHLKKEGESLHELRKQIKRVRYQTEFFRGIYGITYAAQIREFRTMQKILGQLQDQIVISQFLTEEIGENWAEKLPTIDADFQQSRLAVWQQWQPYQQKYLKLAGNLPTSSSPAKTGAA
ncbi:MAG: CHAD domain-containing protein [Cyanobacteria bacterium J06597_16]